MDSRSVPLPALEIHPATTRRWMDLERLFGERGAYAGCWCMWWRMTRSEFNGKGAHERKDAMKEIVDSGEVPGIIAYVDGEPMAWCSVAPRENYGALERSRKLKRIDDEPVWSIVCFFFAKPFRGRGLMVPLLKAAVEYAKQQGAKVVEGYPVQPKEGEVVSGGTVGYMGIASAFRKAGFVEVAQRGDSVKQLIMRHTIR